MRIIEKSLLRKKISYLKVKIWTEDVFYAKTFAKTDLKEEICIAAKM